MPTQLEIAPGAVAPEQSAAKAGGNEQQKVAEWEKFLGSIAKSPEAIALIAGTGLSLLGGRRPGQTAGQHFVSSFGQGLATLGDVTKAQAARKTAATKGARADRGLDLEERRTAATEEDTQTRKKAAAASATNAAARLKIAQARQVTALKSLSIQEKTAYGTIIRAAFAEGTKAGAAVLSGDTEEVRKVSQAKIDSILAAQVAAGTIPAEVVAKITGGSVSKGKSVTQGGSTFRRAK